MRVLCSSVLAIEALVVLLGIPVATSNGSISNPSVAILVGVLLALMLVLSIGTLSRPWGLGLCWVLQAVVLATGLLVPLMFIVGGIFVVLWYAAVHNGRRVDGMRTQATTLPE